MLREILTTGYIDKNIQIDRKKLLSPGKISIKNMTKNPSFKSINSSNKKQISKKNDNIPIMQKKIDIIMNRPDYLLGQNNESTMPTNSINKQYIYSNEITKNIMTPSNVENLNDKEINTGGKSSFRNLNNINNVNKNININQIKPNIKEENINQINSINEINNIINDKIEDKKKVIENDNNNINNIPKDGKKNNISDSKNNLKQENNKSFELNMSLLSAEGIDRLRLLEEYISQIKENSTNINEVKIEQLQKQKNELENSVNILTNNIRLKKKKYKDNEKQKKNLEMEKERVQYDSNKANKDAYDLLKELPNNRVEIEIMKNHIAQAKEETKGIINYTNDIERQTMEIQDELKKINVRISNTIKERDRISNEISAIQKKCNTLKNKIAAVEKSSDEFLYEVGQLAKLTQQNKI